MKLLQILPFLLASALARSSIAQSTPEFIVWPNRPNDSATALQRLLGRQGKVVHAYTEAKAFKIRGCTLEVLDKLPASTFRKVEVVRGGDDQTVENLDSVRGIATALKKARADRDPEASDWLGARQYYISRRAFPFDVVDWAAIKRAAAHRDAMPAARVGTNGTANAQTVSPTSILSRTWQYVGPWHFVNTQGNITGLPPATGRVNAIAVDPTNSSIIFAGTSSGGVWRTTNGGGHWTPLSDSWVNMRISSIAIDPTNTQRIFVGTGDRPGQLGYGSGIMRSEDGGNTWTRLSATTGNGDIDSIIVTVVGKTKVILADVTLGHDGLGNVYRSVDNGNTWNPIPDLYGGGDALAASIVYNKLGKRYLFAASQGGRWVWRSDDAGLTWSRYQTGRWVYADTACIACSPRDARVVYVTDGTSGFGSRAIRGNIFVSTNAGQDWTEITDAFPNGTGDSAWGQAGYNYFLACSAEGGRDVLYLGLLSVFVSTDGGGHWQDIGGAYTSAPTTHTDQHFALVSPSNPRQVYIGNDGGISMYTHDASSGLFTNTNLNSDLNAMLFYKVAVDPISPNILLGGAQDNGCPFTPNDLTRWYNVSGGDGADTAINPVTRSIQYSSSQYLGVIRTNNSWASAGAIGPALATDELPAFIAPMQLDPNDPLSLYGGAGNLYRWREDTLTWTQVTATPLATDRLYPGISAIAVAPGASNVLYVATAEGKLYESFNWGSNWRDISDSFDVFSSISVNPSNPYEILAASSNSGGLRLCADTTQTYVHWSSASGTGASALPHAPINSIVRDPYDWFHTWYAGTDVGVFLTQDGGATWTNATNPLGLPNVEVDDLKIGRSTKLLNAATYGRGIWRISVSRPPLNLDGFLKLSNLSPVSPLPDPAFQLRDSKSLFVFDTRTSKLDSGGNFTLEDLPYLSFNLSIQYRSFLRRSLFVDPFASNQTLELDLVNGDVNGDNLINDKDLNTVLALEGLKQGENGYLDNADVNADGVIDDADYQIVKANLGAVGDQ